VEFLITQDRMICPAPGLNGGGNGAPVRLLLNGEPPAPDSTFYSAGYLTLSSDQDVLLWDFAGGGGWGVEGLAKRRGPCREDRTAAGWGRRGAGQRSPAARRPALLLALVGVQRPRRRGTTGQTRLVVMASVDQHAGEGGREGELPVRDVVRPKKKHRRGVASQRREN
jgi:hypothetical protein